MWVILWSGSIEECIKGEGIPLDCEYPFLLLQRPSEIVLLAIDCTKYEDVVGRYIDDM